MIYVDDSRTYIGRAICCQMFGDSLTELHAFAKRLHLGKWAYTRGETLAHYHVSMRQRARAVEMGAVEVDTEWVRERIRGEIARIEARAIARGERSGAA